MKDKLQNILDEISIFFVVPILIFTLFVSTLVTTALTPNIVVNENSIARVGNSNEEEVLGAQQYVMNSISVNVMSSVIESVSYDKDTGIMNVECVLEKGERHKVVDQALILQNNSENWKRIVVTPDVEEIPSGIEVALTEGNVSNVLIDSNKNIYPMELQISPNAKIEVGYRIDSKDSMNYSFDFDYEIEVFNILD